MTVPVLNALVIGAVLALALIAATLLFAGSSGWVQLIVLLPPLALLGVALGLPPRGWLRRLARGLLGSLLAALAALQLILRVPELFPYPADQGGTLYIALLCVLASIPGFAAAASPEPRSGSALALGFALGLAAPLLLHGELGVPLLLGLGALIGVVVGRLPLRRSA